MTANFLASRVSPNPELEILRRELGEQKRRAAYYKQLWMKERFANLKMYHKSRELKKDELYEANLKKFMTIASESRKTRAEATIRKKRFTTPTREELIEQSKELEKRLSKSSFLKETKRELSFLEQEFSMKSSTLSDDYSKIFSLIEEEKKQESPIRESTFETKLNSSFNSSYCFTQANLPSKTAELLARSKNILDSKKPAPTSEKVQPKKIQQENLTNEEKARIKSRIQKEVEQWTKNKSLRIILNKFFNFKYRGAGYLTPDVSFNVLRKSYRKAVSKIHPDVHMNSTFETKCRNEAILFALQNAYERAGKKRKF